MNKFLLAVTLAAVCGCTAQQRTNGIEYTIDCRPRVPVCYAWTDATSLLRHAQMSVVPCENVSNMLKLRCK